MGNTIYIGSRTDPIYTLTNAEVRTVTAVLSSALIGDELPIDQCSIGIITDAYLVAYGQFIPAAASGLITADGLRFRSAIHGSGFRPPLPYGTPIYWERDGVLMGKFFAQSLDRTSQIDFTLVAVSRVGLLDKQQHMGGLYTGETFSAVLEDILGAGVPYTIAPELQGQSIYNWLPIASRRENLHQLLFAMGAVISKDANGELYFGFPDPAIIAEISDDRVYTDGQSTTIQPTNRVELTEHSYYNLDTDETVTLFDNSDGVSGSAADQLIEFPDAPIHDLQASDGLTVTWSNCNAAKVSGVGILTGKKYTHVTRIIPRSITAGNDSVVAVDKATLVSVANAENVADRLLAYYSAARTINTAIVVRTELPGQRVRLKDPFYEQVEAFIQSAEFNSSGILRGALQLIADYIPQKGGNSYSTSQLLTGSGTFTVPSGVTRLLAVLMSGGDGGGGGYDAPDLELPENPETYTTTTSDLRRYQKGYSAKSLRGGEPGAAGIPGSGGKILIVTITVSPGQQIAYISGIGGAPGTAGLSPTAGSAGTDTTFGAYTSANGQKSETGYIDQFTGTAYAAPGAVGIAGARGAGYVDDGNGNYVANYPDLTVDGNTWVSGTSLIAQSVSQSAGYYNTNKGSYRGQVYGSFGGGPAYGANGSAGMAPESSQITVSTSEATVRATIGGQGGTAQPPADSTRVGAGGGAGNGGGGAGAQGIAVATNSAGENASPGGLSTLYAPRVGRASPGGKGSRGSRGGPGGILLYY